MPAGSGPNQVGPRVSLLVETGSNERHFPAAGTTLTLKPSLSSPDRISTGGLAAAFWGVPGAHPAHPQSPQAPTTPSQREVIC